MEHKCVIILVVFHPGSKGTEPALLIRTMSMLFEFQDMLYVTAREGGREAVLLNAERCFSIDSPRIESNYNLTTSFCFCELYPKNNRRYGIRSKAITSV
jgi:hypothetical protein